MAAERARQIEQAKLISPTEAANDNRSLVLGTPEKAALLAERNRVLRVIDTDRDEDEALINIVGETDQKKVNEPRGAGSGEQAVAAALQKHVAREQAAPKRLKTESKDWYVQRAVEEAERQKITHPDGQDATSPARLASNEQKLPPIDSRAGYRPTSISEDIKTAQPLTDSGDNLLAKTYNYDTTQGIVTWAKPKESEVPQTDASGQSLEVQRVTPPTERSGETAGANTGNSSEIAAVPDPGTGTSLETSTIGREDQNATSGEGQATSRRLDVLREGIKKLTSWSRRLLRSRPADVVVNTKATEPNPPKQFAVREEQITAHTVNEPATANTTDTKVPPESVTVKSITKEKDTAEPESVLPSGKETVSGPYADRMQQVVNRVFDRYARMDSGYGRNLNDETRIQLQDTILESGRTGMNGLVDDPTSGDDRKVADNLAEATFYKTIGDKVPEEWQGRIEASVEKLFTTNDINSVFNTLKTVSLHRPDMFQRIIENNRAMIDQITTSLNQELASLDPNDSVTAAKIFARLPLLGQDPRKSEYYVIHEAGMVNTLKQASSGEQTQANENPLTYNSRLADLVTVVGDKLSPEERQALLAKMEDAAAYDLQQVYGPAGYKEDRPMHETQVAANLRRNLDTMRPLIVLEAQSNVVK